MQFPERIRSPGISFYIAAFFILALLLFLLIASWMVRSIGEVQDEAMSSAQRSALREVEDALGYTLKEAQRYADNLAEWDETRQQLGNPTFYPYWRENRALQGKRLPSYGFNLELYGPQGQPLVRTGPLHAFPAQLPAQKVYVEEAEDGIVLYHFAPILSREHARTLGHVGVRIDFLAALLQLNQFRFLDPESLSLELGPDEHLPPDQLLEHIHFTLLPGIDGEQLEALLRDTLRYLVVAGVLLGLVYFLSMHSLLGRPLRHLTLHIDELRAGKRNPYLDDSRRRFPLAELETLRLSFNQYQYSLDQARKDLDRKNAELWDLAHLDPLTGVYNRRAYDEDWEHLLSLVKGRRHRVTVMLFDCDHFKAINDSYGHVYGDRVLLMMAQTLREALREGDRLYRLGGDEFALLLLDTEVKECHALAQRCLAAVNRCDFRSLGIREPVRLSIGLAHGEGSAFDELQQLHRQADIAMYQAKRPGGNKIIGYQPEMAAGAEALVSSRYLNALHQFIDSGQGLQAHFQPIHALDGQGLSYQELLVRFIDEQGLILPAHILPVVESHNLETEFDFAIIAHLAGLLERAQIPKGINLSLNLAGPSLLHPELDRQLARLRPHLQRHAILLEITENTLITELWQASEVLRSLRQEGFQIALDDFGSGYSSLRYLANMPVDIIKFDIAMIHDLERRDRQRLIVRDIARMICDAGYQLVAEGVESESMLEEIRQVGFTHAQGFLFGQPRPLEALQQSLERGPQPLLP